MAHFKVRIEKPKQWPQVHAIEVYLEAAGPLVAGATVVDKFNSYVGVDEEEITKIIEIEAPHG